MAVIVLAAGVESMGLHHSSGGRFPLTSLIVAPAIVLLGAALTAAGQSPIPLEGPGFGVAAMAVGVLAMHTYVRVSSWLLAAVGDWAFELLNRTMPASTEVHA